MKGILLAGGRGTRLHPLTSVISKQLLPVYDKPMVYYPLSTLMLAGIRDILIISTPEDKCLFKQLLGDGSQLGCHFEYTVQDQPNGLAEAFIIGKEFVGNDAVALILGDNIFYGSKLSVLLQANVNPNGGIIYAYWVQNPHCYGVVDFDNDGQAISIEEKPKNPMSNFAVPGIYFYDNDVLEIARSIKPSLRGELEITDVNKMYMKRGNLSVQIMDRGTAWFDTGSFDSLLKAGQYVQIIEERQGLKIGSIEEVAYRMGFITQRQYETLIEPLMKSGYGKILKNILTR